MSTVMVPLNVLFIGPVFSGPSSFGVSVPVLVPCWPWGAPWNPRRAKAPILRHAALLGGTWELPPRSA